MLTINILKNSPLQQDNKKSEIGNICTNAYGNFFLCIFKLQQNLPDAIWKFGTDTTLELLTHKSLIRTNNFITHLYVTFHTPGSNDLVFIGMRSSDRHANGARPQKLLQQNRNSPKTLYQKDYRFVPQ
jgi:hypothetical protein